MYDQFAYAIQQKYPDLIVLGDNYPPPIERAFMSQVFGIGKLILIGLIIGGQNPFNWFGAQTPSIWTWATENKVCQNSFLSLAVQIAWLAPIWVVKRSLMCRVIVAHDRAHPSFGMITTQDIRDLFA